MMFNILVIDDDLKRCVDLLDYVSENSSCLRLSAIATNLEEGVKILNSRIIDVILINVEESIDKIIDSFQYIENDTFYNTYTKSIVIITDEDAKNFPEHPYIYDFVSPNTKNMEEVVLRKMTEILGNKILSLNNDDLFEEINKQLKFIGYNLSYSGTKYISECIALLYNNYDGSDNLNKNIYPIIAKKHNKTVNTIKCNISKATSSMYYECEESRLKKYFNFYSDTQPKPKLVIYTVLNNLYKNNKNK